MLHLIVGGLNVNLCWAKQIHRVREPVDIDVRCIDDFNVGAATGSPWWVDSLNVLADQTYDIAFVADNPGIWMDHCHNLKHAAQGMIAHLMYDGVDTPYRIAGPADNQPE